MRGWLKRGETIEFSDSKAVEGRDALGLDDAVSAAGSEILEFLRAAGRPVDHKPIDVVTRAEAERNGEFGLGEIAASGMHYAGLHLTFEENAQPCAKGVAIGFGAGEVEPDA